MDYMIRRAVMADAAGISQVIIAALRQTNAADYDAATIARVEQSFSEARIAGLLEKRLIFVATDHDEVVATASLEDDVVRSVFVAPEYQRSGIGEQLMLAVENEALMHGSQRLRVPSSITAQGFYTRLGYSKVRDEYHGDERTIIMEKRLIEP
ncbi:TPA: GNAT family N-acetyltransferase [Pseudomonas putida]|uniref:GNAT family N-acetyltransferase n=1 Tax=Pseudomonas putida TaxID=303 RepID=UPI00110CDCFD|nr:GNAT family N-acetyltransferase [Pseudomonas putida]MCS4062898.1 GNAT superfamily N-acetyltransferase [Pseudomonas putida]MDD1993384.1 GNAT family N-acetyltransferase [Pseudomonas putida]HDS0921385.1 GNAT family N-acetyltransferase [Pseudomonas putida]HDS0934834.1 GNAT family N-acetyltransferase [Pseudomonas putida]HDS1785411.1 GNAT family N-acetyltransferase [Pseudomonas putida]